MINRRDWLLGFSSVAILRGAAMTSTERVTKVLRGEDADRSPFTFWHHFLDETKPAATHAQSTLAFHDAFKTDLVKVMSDYPYPKPKGSWFDLKFDPNPYPQQIQSLDLIKKGLGGKAMFLETIFNPWNVAEKLSSKKEVQALKNEKPQKLLDALEIIAKSQASHAKKAIAAGASGIFLAVANAQAGVLSEADYVKFSMPFDQSILEAVRPAPLNTLHLHTDAAMGDKLYLDRFHHGWPISAINYSLHTQIGIADLRKRFPKVIMAGLDERQYRTLSTDDLRRQWTEAKKAAGKLFILAPGCSIPNDSTPAEKLRLAKLFGA